MEIKNRYAFAITDKNRIVLAINGKAIQEVTKIKGYDILQLQFADDTANKLTKELELKGIGMHKDQIKEALQDTKPTITTGVTITGLLAGIFFIITWIAGVVLAKGTWLTLSAIFFFPYSWYLVVEKIMLIYGLVAP